MSAFLIVDDNEVLRETLASYLRSKLPNHTVLTAEDGAEAIEIMTDKPVSAVFTDLLMPNKDGYEVLSYVHNNFPSIPVVVMTSAWSSELGALVWRLGKINYLEKPFHPEDVDALVKDLLFSIVDHAA